jgi:hypothetical protein
MRCPSCNFPGIKDEACMHIRCSAGPGCSVNWCYCCGRHRRRNQTEDCRGCDSNDILIENQPGWQEYAQLGRPVAGIAARNEFHRRRTRYYIQRIKEETSPELWQQFRQSFPDILTGVPAEGMVIEWDELNHLESSRPPVFGGTTEEDLMWKLPPRLQSSQSSPESQRGTQTSHESLPNLPPWIEVFRSRGGMLWISCALLTVSMFLVQCFRIGNVVLKSVTGLLEGVPLSSEDEGQTSRSMAAKQQHLSICS